MVTSDKITLEQTRALRDAAAAAGDSTLVRDCDRTLSFLERVSLSSSLRLSGYSVPVQKATRAERRAMSSVVEALNQD